MDLACIRSPQDLKRCTLQDVHALIPQLRERIIAAVSENGGHLASNLGAIELTLALHRVFDSPQDKIIFDVGHQCYAHKILTGRAERMASLRRFGGLSGFPRLDESAYDAFGTGHASTAISAALGMARARDLRGGSEHVIALVGDGALTGGMCFEALNDAGSRGTRLIVILNDNGMSISKNVGAVSNYLTYLRASKGWLHAKKAISDFLLRLPVGARPLHALVQRVKNHIRNVFVRDTLFQSLGFTYLGPVDGHDEPGLELFLRRARNFNEPVLLHVVTRKGNGYALSEDQPDRTHGMAPFNPHDGSPRVSSVAQPFGPAAAAVLCQLADRDSRVVAITAAMKEGTGLREFSRRHPDRFFDVGIAEEHAVTMAAGMAAAGLKPYVAIYDTFLQRGYDQVLVDVCCQNLPVTFLIDRCQLGEDGPTHHGVFGISALRHMPNLLLFSPRSVNELKAMLRFASGHAGPVAIRYPRAESLFQAKYPFRGFREGQWERLVPGGDLVLLATGGMVAEALTAARSLLGQGIRASVVNASSIKPLDEGFLLSLSAGGIPFYTLEEHVLAGGFGSAVAEHCAQAGLAAPLHLFALPDAFAVHGSRETLLKHYGLDGESIAHRILALREMTA